MAPARAWRASADALSRHACLACVTCSRPLWMAWCWSSMASTSAAQSSGQRHSQPWPDVGVFSGVVVVQDTGHRRDVVGDKRAALLVPGRHGPDQAGHQPELAAEHGVRREHVTRIGERLVYRCHFFVIPLSAPWFPQLKLPADCRASIMVGAQVAYPLAGIRGLRPAASQNGRWGWWIMLYLMRQTSEAVRAVARCVAHANGSN
jgi:hypothetical protein